MRSPRQIWLLFGIGLSVVVPAMVWLTVKALELDRAELAARKQAELEEDISRALWRMDTLLTPILAEEAARPEFLYRAILETPPSEDDAIAAKGDVRKGPAAAKQELSPLLATPPQFVLLHFEVHPDGSVTSPQNPQGAERDWAVENSVSPEAIGTAESRLATLLPWLDREKLLAQLPESPILAMTAPPAGSGLESQLPESNPQILANNYGIGPDYSQLPNLPPGGDEPGVAQQATPPNSASQQAGQFDQPQQQAFNPEPSQLQQDAGAASQLAYAQAPYEVGRSQRGQTRGGNDLTNRSAVLQSYATRSYNQQRTNVRAARPTIQVIEGTSQQMWLGEHLILARRLRVGDQTTIQGCWLDWDAIRQRLQAEVADLLPAVELSPTTGREPIKLSRVLATIPVELSVPAPIVEPPLWSPIRVSLLVAWSCLVLAALAAGVTLHHIIALSERRGAFVAAVTHELRTPLTTFRMYAEMLAGGMVPDPARQREYLQTLRVEADRLTHLVDNVLQYARLERGRPGQRRERVSLADLVEHCRSRLAERAAQAGMELVVELDPADRDAALATDLAAIEQILFNLVDNACKYAAVADDKRMHLHVIVISGRVQIALRDHGPGISATGRARLFQPFSKSVHEAACTAPGVGLGLALCRRLAHDLGGTLVLESPADGGAAFVLSLPQITV
ncbi:MAG: HAMP domain-containing histidine kinase [Pirellulaceae bacterium]|nr:HAMP domain-containing histidine kinase [Pirellulaceae bacterium]